MCNIKIASSLLGKIVAIFLYDLKDFDETLFDRKDLAWIRHDYIIHLMMGWDRQFYDAQDGGFYIQEFLARGKKWYGGDDAWGIWPTWQ